MKIVLIFVAGCIAGHFMPKYLGKKKYGEYKIYKEEKNG